MNNNNNNAAEEGKNAGRKLDLLGGRVPSMPWAELRSSVKVEVVVLGSPPLISLMVSAGVKQS